MTSSPKPSVHRCGATVITGLTGDRCALIVTVDAAPLNHLGEVGALSDGRATYALDLRYLTPRDRWNIPGQPPSHDRPVHATHACGKPLLDIWLLPPLPPPAPAILNQMETPF